MVVAVKSTMQGEEGSTQVNAVIVISTTTADEQGRAAAPALGLLPATLIMVIGIPVVTSGEIVAVAVAEVLQRPVDIATSVIIADADARAQQAARQARTATRA